MAQPGPKPLDITQPRHYRLGSRRLLPPWIGTSSAIPFWPGATLVVMGDPPWTFRHELMVAAIDEAMGPVFAPLTASERADGWTGNLLTDVQKWLAGCQRHIADGGHPRRGDWRTFPRDWDGVPGRAFDHGSDDPRKSRILGVSNAVARVIDFDALQAGLTELSELLARDELGLTEEERARLSAGVRALKDVVDSGGQLGDKHLQTWKECVRSVGADLSGSRFFERQVDLPWNTPEPIGGLVSRVSFDDQFYAD